jgi:manganese-dependent inorganic pyrophosphatase
MRREVVSVLPDTPVAEALAIMDQNSLRVLPVLDEHRHCRGLASVFKMMQFQQPGHHRLFESRRVVATLKGIARTLEAQVIHVEEGGREDDLTLMIGGMSVESFKSRLESYPAHKLLIVVGDRHDIQLLAIEHGVRCIVVTGNLEIRRSLVDAAKACGVSLLLSPHDSMTTAMLCRAAITVNHMLEEDFLTFREDDLLANARRMAAESIYQAFPVLAETGETAGILSKSDFLKKVNRRLILVDHNELSQAVHGAEDAEIIEIIDHHRLGSLSTSHPIYFLNDPVGSTSTIVADCFLRHSLPLASNIAGVLLAGVVSDTLNLTSPTATPRDAVVLKKLEEASGANATKLAEDMFRSGSVLVSHAPAQAITSDCKEYVEDGHRFSVAQIEEIGFSHFWDRKQAVMEALTNHRIRHGHFFSALLVTDVTRQNSLLLMAGDKPMLDAIDYPELETGIFELAEVVSRKKQLLPYLTHCLKQVP